MKKMLIGIGIGFAVIVIVLFGIILFSPKGEEAASTNALADGKLTVGITLANEYYAKEVDGGYEGVEVEIANGIAQKAGVEVEFVVTNQVEAIEMLNVGELDMILAQMGREDDYYGKYLTSIPYANTVIYMANPTGVYTNNLANSLDSRVYKSSKIPSQCLNQVKYFSEVTFADMTAEEEKLGESTMLDSKEVYLLTETEAMHYIKKGSTMQFIAMENSPIIEYVAITHIGEIDLRNIANETINDYLDSLVLEDEAEGEVEDETQE